MQPDQNQNNIPEINNQKLVLEQEHVLNKASENQKPTQAEVQPLISSTSSPVSSTTFQSLNTQITPLQSSVTPKAEASTVIDPSIANFPAEDVDIIEKEWVDKANEIEEKDKDDPYQQDEDQHNLSRAYLKKRFNLDID